MIELPEALNLADQMNRNIVRKKIASVTVGQTPHKLAWYYEDRSRYSDTLDGKAIEKASPMADWWRSMSGWPTYCSGRGQHPVP